MKGWIIFSIIAFCSIIVIDKITKLILRIPKVNGYLGEKRVSRIIKRQLKENEKILNDYRFKTRDGKTVQIDHIIIKTNGIFVIETKNYTGIIKGKESQLEWTQISRANKKYKLYNPVKQNENHIHKLIHHLQQNLTVKSLVVFTKADIKSLENIPNVCNLKEMKIILEEKSTTTLNKNQIEDLYNILITRKENIKDKEHIKNIKIMQENIKNDICPHCKVALIIKIGKNGYFKGCSNYPNCKFTKKI